MNTPIPVNPPTSGFTPSGSTWASGLGGSLAIIVIAILEGSHITVSGSLAAAITTLCAAVAGYLPSSGRK